jgi:hypothetical protein
LAEFGANLPSLVLSNLYANDIFDACCVIALHKRIIMVQIRFHTDPTYDWHSGKKKTRLAREHERKEAGQLRDASLRDAPLLKGFFIEEPQLRDRMLRWCEKSLSS